MPLLSHIENDPRYVMPSTPSEDRYTKAAIFILVATFALIGYVFIR